MLNPFKLLAIYSDLNKIEDVAKGKAVMALKLTQIGGLLVQIIGMLGLATAATHWVGSHLMAVVIINLVLSVGHAVLPSVIPGPVASLPSASGPGKVGMILLMIGFVAMAPGIVFAQSTANGSNGFAAASSAVAIHYGGAWSAGTHVTESYDFVDFGQTKSNHLYVEGHELLAPTPGFNIYAGGLRVEPDLSDLLKKTNLPASNFGVTLSAALGNGVPSSGNSHISFLAGGGVKYQLTSALAWKSLEAAYGQFGGNRFAVISTGLSFVFGGH